MARHPLRALLVAAVVALAPPAWAEDAADAPPRAYCPSRPGLGTTPCTIAPGHVSLEFALLDWERDGAAGARRDSLLIGDLTVRAGLSPRLELGLDWTPYGAQWERDERGRQARTTGMGDVTLSAKLNLASPDGSGFSLAVMPFIASPVGGRAFGSGGWGTGVLIPASVALTDRVSLQLTPELDLATDSDGRGRHPAYSLIAGVSLAPSDRLSLTAEVAAGRDHDPAGTVTQVFASGSASFAASRRFQLHGGIIAGLNEPAPDVRSYFGVARLF